MTNFQDDGLALHTDFYELNMMWTYWQQGVSERNAVFEVFFRKLPLVVALRYSPAWST